MSTLFAIVIIVLLWMFVAEFKERRRAALSVPKPVAIAEFSLFRAGSKSPWPGVGGPVTFSRVLDAVVEAPEGWSNTPPKGPCVEARFKILVPNNHEQVKVNFGYATFIKRP
jgi:hypothetical protein